MERVEHLLSWERKDISADLV
uniref:Uncharacterized protein n=1 Tax=Arundo donax TaxID=35708 RepID=A0A0A8ZPC0_ARUDO